jgi:hypothetical protein
MNTLRQLIACGERVQRWLPPHCPSCLTGAFGVQGSVTRYRHFIAACSVGKCPRALTALR